LQSIVVFLILEFIADIKIPNSNLRKMFKFILVESYEKDILKYSILFGKVSLEKYYLHKSSTKVTQVFVPSASLYREVNFSMYMEINVH